jgi:hypothetical protein
LKYDFKQAFTLWNEVLKRQPLMAVAVARLAELKLMLEGRASSRELLLQFLNQNATHLSPESERDLRDKLRVLGSTFVSDEGQSLYLQALARIRHQECTSALPLLDRAVYLEAGNLNVLVEKARCEKTMGQIEHFYDTAKAAYESDPFDKETLDPLLDGHLYFKQFSNILGIFRRTPELFVTNQQKTAVAVSFGELGSAQQSLDLLHRLMDVPRASNLHPILFYEAGKILSSRADSTSEAESYLERFISLAQAPQNYLFDGWDPYRCTELVPEAKKMLVALKPKE